MGDGMAGRGGGEPLPRAGRSVVVAVLGGFACIYGLAGLGLPGGVAKAAGAGVVAVTAVGLQLCYVLPSWRRLRGRWLLPVQVLVGGLAVAGFGLSMGVLGFLGGSLLLRGRPWAAGVVLVGGVAVVGAQSGAGAEVGTGAMTVVLISLVVYGLTRLADRVEETAAARLALAMSAVGEERLRIAAELTEALGHGLDVISRDGVRALQEPGRVEEILVTTRRALAGARTAAAGFRGLSLGPEVTAAQALLAGVDMVAEIRVGHVEPLGPAGALLAEVLREAVTDVVRLGTAGHCTIVTEERAGLVFLRVRNDGVATAAQGADRLEELAVRVAAAGGRLTTGLDPQGRFSVEASVVVPARSPDPSSGLAYRPSLVLLGVVLAGFSLAAVLQVPARAVPVAGVLAALICWLQFRWVRPAAAGRPRYWAAALLLQAALSFLPLIWFGKPWGGLAVFLAGSLLLAFPPPLAWPLVTMVMAGMGLFAVLRSQSVPVVINAIVSALVTGLIVYGLVRLAQLVDALEAAGRELARASVVQERLRAARDLHDLLGHSLAAILLKCELARRLTAVDPVRARAELTDVVRLAEQARADIRAVAGAAAELSFETELASARSVLTAAGIAVELTVDAAPVPARSGAVLSVVLREAVTNVLRHSAAEHCRIALSADAGGLRLSIANDGLDPAAPRTAPGAGIGNLTTRLAAHGGRLVARPDASGWFRIEAELDAMG